MLLLKVGNIIKPLPHTGTNMNRAKPTKMQARGSGGGQNQNQSPNVGATAAASTSGNSNEVKAMLDSVLEISLDKRNTKSGNRGGKRKRANPINPQEATNGSSVQ